MILINTCDTCSFYRSTGDDPTMCCTFYPPSVTMVPVGQDSAGGLQIQKLTAFPSPDPTWTCGKHRSRRAN